MAIRIAGCVILYNPEQSVEQHIISYINKVDKLYIIDNSENPAKNFELLTNHNFKIIFISDEVNEGIAKRLNHVCDLAIKEGFEFMLTMDQDSYFDESSIKNYFNCVDAFKDKMQASMFGASYKQKPVEINCSYIQVKQLITSGSIINLETFKIVGNFDENLFIDFVDTEYCFRSILKGYKLIEFFNIYMHHNLGQLSEQRSLKNLKKTNRTFHTHIRLYYMLRNFLYLNSKYKEGFKAELEIYKKDLLNRIKNNLLYKKERFRLLNLLIKAWKDYKKNKMAKFFG